MSKVADFWMKIAQSLRDVSSKYANKSLNKAKNQDAKMVILFPNGEGDIDIFFESPGFTFREWSHYYKDVGVFVDGKIEEIKLDTDQLQSGEIALMDKTDMDSVMLRKSSKSLWGFRGRDTKEIQNWIIIGGIAVVGLILGNMVI